jgi:hypothetical protein
VGLALGGQGGFCALGSGLGQLGAPSQHQFLFLAGRDVALGECRRGLLEAQALELFSARSL